MFWQKRLIAEFEEQSFTQIIFPHVNTDWNEYLNEAQECFIAIIKAVTEYQKCLVVCENIEEVQQHFEKNENLYFVQYTTDDTWARDCSALSIADKNEVQLLNFTFNAWGEKFDAQKDNKLTTILSKCYSAPVHEIDFVLEGGAIESNGTTTLLTTSACMLNTNRNSSCTKNAITRSLKSFFGAKEILYLYSGHLIGDDTDSHIDTLARFIDTNKIMYVTCEDKEDEHYQTLLMMEKELQEIAKVKKYTLIPLPLPSAIYFDNKRLPATYANFLFVNGAVLVPTYNVKEDTIALKIFQETFQTRDIIPIDCSVLIRQHGSLHCVSMNFPAGITLLC
ncbi:agmatine deiminase family protein [Sulfurimonas sp.]